MLGLISWELDHARGLRRVHDLPTFCGWVNAGDKSRAYRLDEFFS
jgi:hypothetical protein